MKLLARAAMAAIVSVTAASAALLPAGPAAAHTTAKHTHSTSSTPLNSSSLIGTWTNSDPSSISVQNIVISHAPTGGILVDAFGACVMSKDLKPCEWGNVHPVLFKQINQEGVDPAAGTAFRAEWSWEHGHGRSILAVNLMVMNGKTVLSVDEPRIYVHKPHMGPNFDLSEIFVPAASPMTPSKNGTTVVDDFPIGNFASAPAAILGTWTNPFPAEQGVDKVTVTKNRDGSITLHAWGVCSPTPCDWGTSYGITFSEGIGPTSGVDEDMFEIVSPFRFHGKETLLCIELMDDVEGMGPALMVAEFTDYMPHGHPDINNPNNYNNNEVFFKS